jgi:hypothetical protein
MKKKKNTTKWRSNYVVTYFDGSYTKYRFLIIETLKMIAFLQNIDCAVSIAHKFVSEPDLNVEDDINTVSDIVYFRASSKTRLSGKEFRKMIDLVFYDYEFSLFYPVDCGWQYQHGLNLYPYPVTP